MKPAVILALLAVVTAVFATFLFQERRPPSSFDRGPVIPDFQPESIAAIRLSGEAHSTRLVLGPEGWEVEDRDGYSADNSRVLSLVRKVWDLRPTQSIEVDVGQLGRFQLAPPEANAGPEETASRIEFMDSEGNVLATLDLGKRQVREGTAGMPGRAVGRYVRNLADPSRVLLVAETFGEAAPAPELWLDPTFLQIPEPVVFSLSGREPERNWRMVRGEGTWSFSDEDPDILPDQDAVLDIKSAWLRPYFHDVISGEEAAAFEPLEQATIQTSDGLEFQIQVGTPAQNVTPVRFFVELVEEPDAAGEADEALADQLAARKAALEDAKEFEGPVFLVPNHIVDSLSREKSTLLPESDNQGE